MTPRKTLDGIAEDADLAPIAQKIREIADPWLDEPWTEEELRVLDDAERNAGVPWV